MQSSFVVPPLLALLASATAAIASETYTGATLGAGADDWIVAVDSSVSVTSQGGRFGSVGATAAPSGSLDRDGIRVHLDATAGEYSYRTGDGTRVRGRQAEAAAMVGYEWGWSDASLAGFVGLNLRNNTLSIIDANNPVVGTALGLKTALSFYARPSAGTMVSAFGTYTTAHGGYYVRGRAGLALAEDVFVGPEATLLGDDYFNQWRVGGHLSGLSFGPTQVSLAAGYLHDRINKGGFYSTVDVRTGF